jgi:predicted AAA+ superfamily ATPase
LKLKKFAKNKMTDYQKVRQDFETQSAITYDSAGKLKKKDIQELKSFANPPKMVKDILSLLMPILDPKVNIKKIEYNDC